MNRASGTMFSLCMCGANVTITRRRLTSTDVPQSASLFRNPARALSAARPRPLLNHAVGLCRLARSLSVHVHRDKESSELTHRWWNAPGDMLPRACFHFLRSQNQSNCCPELCDVESLSCWVHYTSPSFCC